MLLEVFKAGMATATPISINAENTPEVNNR
jgi:hypothetical protein